MPFTRIDTDYQASSRHLLILRPEPGASRTAKQAIAAGWRVTKTPLAEAIPLSWALPSPASYEAVMVTSAQAIYHGGAELQKLVNYPLYAVGKTTAQAAVDAGFSHIIVANGNGESLIERLKQDGRTRILRLCGEIHKTYLAEKSEFQENQTFFLQIVYKMQDIDCLPMAACQALTQQAIVLLHSSRFAERFRFLLKKTNINPDRVPIAVISPTVAEQVGKTWQATAVAEYPDDIHLLKAAASLEL
ncbi:MAG: uroporphyrinogen-III synthase [Zymomonas mobilis subsp. pomaceae]|uniref:Uroporphyrinogen-III synthase-like protein n=1 Tax=Zymomonas mobilis subsp. pomaceae (strain ATCC 29192 / DSM 22645 / JCM 10191 / CCUG 17912 / NBRC 13757 / NCIMB 11200 / NRRL B-4491 / Barker I) TaxID=579138 RepID=F8EU93_ZYMMT|nr:uroporphyrinogen-III synthase [Zymomonas mobilis]AEI38114.1 Uroporphyrinogen-III synthase-like protein [Zymomonas mobilis subsp. pomaceae ATCC 29192]MDX5949480.1 uroporphyrinogen-III synthase [Zymomonas mobilis subsp. pomaceae]GEB89223.1 hypothetical protein ZMO02_08600 [Zymomonas mobilis subsp. pomaceae]